jgi:sec-independent protein translocase protein TatA
MQVALLGLGGEEIVLVLVAILLLFGATKIPELARAMGRAKGEFQKGAQEGDEMAKASVKDAPPIEAVEDARVRKAAEEMGIATEGRPLSDIKAEMRAVG